MQLREMLEKKGPKVVKQGDVTGTLWLERGGAMKVKVLGAFDVEKFVHTMDIWGREQFALKISNCKTLDFLPEKEYEVEWAIAENGLVLPDEYTETEFVDRVVVKYPYTALAGVIDDRQIDLGGGVSGLTRLACGVTGPDWKQTTTKWLDVEVSRSDGEVLFGGDGVARLTDKLSLGMSLSYWRPVVAKEVTVVWVEGGARYERAFEFGGEPIFEYTEKFDGGLSAVVMEKGGAPMKLLAGILDKDLEPLKLWRSFTLLYSGKNGFLEDKMKNLLVAVDSIYAMRPEDAERISLRGAEYDTVVAMLKECVDRSGNEIEWKKISDILKNRKYYAGEGADYSAKMKWLCEVAGVNTGTLNEKVDFDNCVRISHKIRNNLSHHGTFRDVIRVELGENLGVYYAWLIMTVQKCIWAWLTGLSNEWNLTS